jgi:uncharacterized membrane protein YgcG
MVALVLIYMLVVWEFGNFRIPALIMAPIPLTLLGIIPAHFIFFKLGWGGEFTATSMIGWIALAGIIVRNSILLVDFSIHEIQHGSSVVEAVIQACKTRSRPILITALALVCGSSVIFFDPIFQGMAISLASGVMVSTILTLIVIPLGCIKASKDLIEVAVATAPPGVEVPVLEDSSKKAQQPKPEKPAAAARTPLWMVVWSKLFGVISMLFYLVRGIFLMLFQLFKKKPKPAKASPPASGSSGSSGSSGPSGGGGQSPGGVSDPPATSNPPVSKVSQAAAVETSADVVVEKTAQRSVVDKDKSVPVQSESVVAPQVAPKAQETAKDDGDKQTPPQRVKPVSDKTDEAGPGVSATKPGSTAPKPKKRPSALQSQKSSKETDKGPAKGGNGSSKASESASAPRTQEIAPAIPMKKKAGRRGIRLKT